MVGLLDYTKTAKQGDEIILQLACRRNLPQGSTLRRKCWCPRHGEICPVHALWPFFEGLPVGHRPFASLKVGSINEGLRRRLGALMVPKASLYRTHDFRRGHARDLQASGASLVEILQAGQWKSPAFLNYLDVNSLESEAVLQAHLEESSDSDDDVF